MIKYLQKEKAATNICNTCMYRSDISDTNLQSHFFTERSLSKLVIFVQNLNVIKIASDQQIMFV